MLKGILVVSGLLLVFGLAPAPATSLPDVTVSMVNFAFTPQTVTVQMHAGPGGLQSDLITFVNNSPSTHRPHDDPHAGAGEALCFDTGNVAPGASASVRISPQCAATHGFTVTYHCHIHPVMTGTINVVIV
jgi:plastocyanin